MRRQRLEGRVPGSERRMQGRFIFFGGDPASDLNRARENRDSFRVLANGTSFSAAVVHRHGYNKLEEMCDAFV